jgi:hypothetical protein
MDGGLGLAGHQQAAQRHHQHKKAQGHHQPARAVAGQQRGAQAHAHQHEGHHPPQFGPGHTPVVAEAHDGRAHQVHQQHEGHRVLQRHHLHQHGHGHQRATEAREPEDGIGQGDGQQHPGQGFEGHAVPER